MSMEGRRRYDPAEVAEVVGALRRDLAEVVRALFDDKTNDDVTVSDAEAAHLRLTFPTVLMFWYAGALTVEEKKAEIISVLRPGFEAEREKLKAMILRVDTPTVSRAALALLSRLRQSRYRPHPDVVRYLLSIVATARHCLAVWLSRVPLTAPPPPVLRALVRCTPTAGPPLAPAPSPYPTGALA